MRFGYPDVGPRFDQDRPDRPAVGLGSGRFWMRLVVAAILVGMAVLAIVGRTDTAAGIGWVLLPPLGIVLGLVELTSRYSSHVWDGEV